MVSITIGTILFILGCLALAVGIVKDRQHPHHWEDKSYISWHSDPEAIRLVPDPDGWLVVEKKVKQRCSCGREREAWRPVVDIESDDKIAKRIEAVEDV